MNRLQTYLFRQLFISTVFIALTLTMVLWLTQSVRFIKFILNRGLDLSTFLHLTVLLIPGFWLVILPLSLFFATLFTYNKITNDRELVVMRSAGLGQFGLAKPALALGLLLSLFCYFLSLYLVPICFREFRDLRQEIQTNVSAGLIQPGTFNRLGNGLTIYVRSREGNQMRGVIVHDSRNPEVRVTMLAERGIVVRTGQGPRVLMVNGSRQERNLKTGNVSMLYFNQYSFALTQPGGARKRIFLLPEERFLHQLLFPDNSPHDRQYRSQLIAEGHNRLVAPLAALLMPLIALVALLAGEFNKRGQIVRLVGACGVVACFQGAALGLFSVTAKFNFMIPLAYLNVIVPAGFLFYLLLRERRRPKPINLPAHPPGAAA